MENERKHMWKWIQPTQDQILPRLRDCFELNMCERERENMCSVAHGEIVFLRAENELLRKLVDLLADDLHLIELGYVLAEKSTPANLRRAILAAKPDIATARAALST